MTNADDLRDIEAARTGDTKAFTELVRRHDDRLRRFVHGLVRNPVDLDDLLQDAYLKAFRSIGSFRADSSFATWLHRIAYNAVIDASRSGARRAASIDDTEVDFETQVDNGESGHVDDMDVAMSRLDVAAALRGLPEKQRAAILLVDGHGYDYASVGAILGIPSGTVGFHLHRARKTLRALLVAIEEER